MIFFLTAAVSYLLGSIPFGYLLVRLFRGEDVRKSGSGNIGATNVARSSPALGLLTLVLDAGKGVVAVLLALWLANRMGHYQSVLIASPEGLDAAKRLAQPLTEHRYLVGTLASFFAILGHLFPVWLKFRGGKGVATALGSLVVIAPKSILCVIVIFLLLFLIFRYVSFSSVVAIACFPLAAWFFHEYGDQSVVLGMMALAAVLIIWKHRANLRRLLDGTEPKFERRA
jgi:glycerol-3-phosphate acyltransferase PlsY